MSSKKLYLYHPSNEPEPSNDVQRIIFEVVDDIDDHVDVSIVDENDFLSLTADIKVVVFGGHVPPVISNFTINTISYAQVATKPNAKTLLKAAFNLALDSISPIINPVSITTWTPLDVIHMFELDQPISVDIETNGNFNRGDTPEDVDIISIGFHQSWGLAPVVIMPDENGVWPNGIRELLKAIEKPVGHNIKFDMRIINRYFNIKMAPVHYDTMLAHHVMNHAGTGTHGLKEAAQTYLGAPDWEADIKKYVKGSADYSAIPKDKLAQYNGADVYWTTLLMEYFDSIMDDEERVAFELELAASDFLLDVEAHGIAVDFSRLNRLQYYLSNQMQIELHALQMVTGDSAFNPGSPKQVKNYLNTDHGLNVTSTDEATIENILASNPSGTLKAFCENLLAYRAMQKALKTNVEGVMDRTRNGRVHSTFLIHGTKTGRLSSRDPNLQNIPREKTYRGIFVAGD